MHRRLLLALGASALLLASSLPATALAADPDGVRHQLGVGKLDPSLRPRSADAARPVTVMLQLRGVPAVRAGTTQAAQRSQAKQLRTFQTGVAAAVGKHGAKVIGRYQYAYNGLKVRTTASKLDELAAIPGVLAIRPVRTYTQDNANGHAAMNVPTAWETAGATGDGVIVAVIDSGIDYTHATFGGTGTEEAFDANDPNTVEAGTFPTTKVIAGYDFAGEAYDADADDGSEVPVPDDDPLDCGGHGSHVAGTIAGFGVKTDHTTFTGRYTSTTVGDGSDFVVAPGVAPEAKLVGLKVFGCEGSTNLVVDALDWVAAYNAQHIVGIDVVNMSLGAPFGSNTDPDAVATNNLVAGGVVVVASAGNEGAVDYITGAPAAASRAISVAALDALPTLPMATIGLTGGDIPALNMNDTAALPITDAPVTVLDDGAGGLLLGCEAGDFAGVTAGDVVVIQRGVCAFVDKGALAQAAGAAAVVVVNRDDLPADAYPSYLGDSAEYFTIPMLGTTNAVKAALIAADGQTTTLSSAADSANPTYNQIAGFSSSGPRWGDSALKADVAAPGVSVASTGIGSGWNSATMSGTSMAAPMTAGAAALVVQAHPAWTPLKVKAALVNTADKAGVIGYTPLRSGSGAVKADRASQANVVAYTSDLTASLSYGYVQLMGAWSAAKKITIANDGPSSARYSLASSSSAVKLSTTSVTVPAHSSVTVTATASRSSSSVAAMCSPDWWVSNACTGLYTISGAVTATPVSPKAGQYALRVPFLIVPRGASNVVTTRSSTWTKSGSKISGRLNFANSSVHKGNADVYALGLTDASGDGVQGTDVRAAGVQVLPPAYIWSGADPGDKGLVFAVNLNDRYSSAAVHEYDVLIDTDGDGNEDYVLFALDPGLWYSGAYSGDMWTFIYDVAADTVYDYQYAADAPLNGSTILLSALASDIGVTSSQNIRYAVFAWNGFSGVPDMTGWSKAFNPFSPKQSTGQFKTVNAKSATYTGAWFYRVTDVRGWMVVTMDDRNGSYQADLVTVPSKP